VGHLFAIEGNVKIMYNRRDRDCVDSLGGGVPGVTG